MGKGFEQLEDLKDDGIRYVRLKWISLRLSAAENLSALLAKAFGYLIFLVLLFIGLIFLMFALALLLGEVLGQMWLGFLISGGVFLLAGLIAYFIRGRMMLNSFVRTFVDLFFESKSDSDGKRD